MQFDAGLLLAIALAAAVIAGLWTWAHRLENWARDLRSGLDSQSRSVRSDLEAFDRHCQERFAELARRLRK